MRLKFTFSSLLCLIFSFQLTAQSTSMEVYNIFQAKCASCHSNANPQSGLDLEGSGATAEMRALDVYNNIVNVNPVNDHAASENYKLIYPGRTDKSFLFRKMATDFEPYIVSDVLEEQQMPPYGSEPLTEIEKEMIRQWILYGAPQNGQVVNPTTIENYYNVAGAQSFPDGPPTAPAAGEGFQIKMGPFYLNPSGTTNDELEYFLKYGLDMPADQEIVRMDIKMSGFSHHFLIYDFYNGGQGIPAGLRLEPDHSDIGLVAAVTEATDLNLPSGTAFKWENDLVLDLNSHYINYDAGNTYQAEAYVNVYTQPIGTAAQEMKTELFVNPFIPIPNNGNPTTHDQAIAFPNLGDVYIWGIMGHTHKYGTGYKVYEREGQNIGEMIYDAACPQGVPGCVSPNFDYQHIPMRYFEPLRPSTISPSVGLEHEASWINNGPFSVNFGATSDDEMMVLVMMYTDEIDGVGVWNKEVDAAQNFDVFPNPTIGSTTFYNKKLTSSFDVDIFDMAGKRLRSYNNLATDQFTMERGDLNKGMYLYTITDEDGLMQTGKLVFQ